MTNFKWFHLTPKESRLQPLGDRVVSRCICCPIGTLGSQRWRVLTVVKGVQWNDRYLCDVHASAAAAIAKVPIIPAEPLPPREASISANTIALKVLQESGGGTAKEIEAWLAKNGDPRRYQMGGTLAERFYALTTSKWGRNKAGKEKVGGQNRYFAIAPEASGESQCQQ